MFQASPIKVLTSTSPLARARRRPCRATNSRRVASQRGDRSAAHLGGVTPRSTSARSPRGRGAWKDVACHASRKRRPPPRRRVPMRSGVGVRRRCWRAGAWATGV